MANSNPTLQVRRKVRCIWAAEGVGVGGCTSSCKHIRNQFNERAGDCASVFRLLAVSVSYNEKE